jgi:hypothetical protein
VVAEVRRLKQQSEGHLLIYGHGLLAETLMKPGLVDVLDLSTPQKPRPRVRGSNRGMYQH